MENIFRIELNFFGIFVSALVIWLFFNQIKKRNQEYKTFLVLASLTLLELVLDTAFWMVDSHAFMMGRLLNYIINFFYYMFQIAQCYIWFLYCKIHLEVPVKRNKIFEWLQALPFLLGVALVVINIWTGCVFTVNMQNVYRRSWGIEGSAEAICCMFYPCYSVVLILGKMITGDKKRWREDGFLILVSIIPLVSSVIQMLFYGLNFIWAGMAMSLLLILIEIEMKQYQQMEQELTEQRISIMLSQIQPHFLYNSLTAITYLCEVDPQKAREATVAFAKYLRGNLDSIKQTQPVPFEKELEHVQIYLFLEKMRFQEELNIVYDIKSTNFMVPALTIQPLVENAVKYGVGQQEEGGEVCISTEEQTDYFAITIEDNGVGFDPYEKLYDGRSHIGIDNVKQRLADMCGGSMTIHSEKNVGTKVILQIPKTNDNKETEYDEDSCGR